MERGSTGSAGFAGNRMINLRGRDQATVLEAIADWDNARAPVLTLEVGGEDFSGSLKDGIIRHDGISISLESTLVGPFPRKLEGADAKLAIVIEDVEVPLLTGFYSLPQSQDDQKTTSFSAVSAGAMASRFPLDETVIYPGVSPTFMARDALRRLPYAAGGVRVKQVDSPLQYFAIGAPDGPFTPDQKVSDILSKVTEQAFFIFRDDAFGGHEAFVSQGLAQLPETVAEYAAEDLIFWKSPTLALDQYSQVVVFQLNADGSDAFDPARADVVYIGHDSPPPAGAKYRVPLADTSTDAPARAQQKAYDQAKAFARGLYTNQPILIFHPLYQRTDSFTVNEKKDEESGGIWERLWMHYIDTLEHDWDRGFATKPTCTVTLLEEQLVKSPVLILSLASTGVMPTFTGPDLSDAVGSDATGFWYEEILTGDWIGLDSSGAWIDESLADGKAGVDTHGFWFDF